MIKSIIGQQECVEKNNNNKVPEQCGTATDTSIGSSSGTGTA
jgi:hypothetical protein